MTVELVFAEQIAAPASEGSLGDQTGATLDRLEERLGRDGLGLEDLLRLRMFVAEMGESAAIEEALQTRLGSELPAVSIIELPASSHPSGGSVSLDAVVAPEAGKHRRLAPGATRLGAWVFLGAIAAIEPRALFRCMEERLREQGAQLRDVVRLGSWLTFPMRDYGPFGAVRRELVASAGLLPASAGVQVGRVGLAGERLACEAIAYAPEGRSTHEPHVCAEQSSSSSPELSPHPISRLADFYLDARAAGGYVFTSGEVPDGRGPPGEQAHEVYERLRVHLAAHGAGPADVLQQTVFVRAARDGESPGDGDVAVTEAERAFYGAPAPPTTLLPVADLGFVPGCAVEIELVARIAGSRGDERNPAGKQPVDAR